MNDSITLAVAHDLLHRPEFGNAMHIEAFRLTQMEAELRNAEEYELHPRPNDTAESLQGKLDQWELIKQLN